MPKFLVPLQDEITRLARKEVVKSQGTLKKAVTSLRRENTELRKRVKSLEKAVDALQKILGGTKKINALPSDDEVKNSRFSPKMITRMRKKHGLSIKKMAELLDVNNNSIINWEKGDFRPRQELKRKLLAFKKLTKRDVKKMLKELSGKKADVVPVIETKKVSRKTIKK
ncbi:MAG: Helix-turn-helix domain protein [Candidatus Uhrbacteria bacterium GW2011_GWF2_39_13]|uniref:Helix-turn-helix domain protein n=1 Tax=Candidatus Uhrbacteria bacterium GW2011_GWF2_39_13 TaxID=1618995 RepID=A0A0G0MVB6_9BACT|nr:MAG: Helix-turn-helix domain protein [Candidatus Uhrbacteria bacterium GW2011_GWF2_39_13]